MKILLLTIGKTSEDYIKVGIEEYSKRIQRYIDFNIDVIPNIKKGSSFNKQVLKLKEGEVILSKLEKSDFVVLLDENGRNFSSIKFSEYLQNKMLTGMKRLVFVIGGAYGFSDELYSRSDSKISLSSMTFSHQLIRVIFLEQLYRSFTILKGEPYHHE